MKYYYVLNSRGNERECQAFWTKEAAIEHFQRIYGVKSDTYTLHDNLTNKIIATSK